jgi:tripartite-type tricarboxylate transporter receptor subunit TctC
MLRGFLSAALFAAAVAAAGLPQTGSAQAQVYPSRTIRLIVGFAAGGGNDLIARILAQELQNSLGQAVVVENKVGAGGRVAAEFVKGQPADGYTLLIGASGAMAISVAVSDKLHYSTLKDFVPISKVADFPLFMVVNPSHPAKTVKEFVEWAKANPDKSNYGTSSTAFTLAMELFKLKSGMPAVAIPYKSGNEMVLGVLGGQSAVTIVDPPPAIPQIQGGKARALAVTDSKRMSDLPDVPTMDEAGYPDVHVSLWSGVFAPANTPEPVVKRLESELQRILKTPEIAQKFRAMATNAVGSSSQQFKDDIAREVKMWRNVADAAHLTLE